MKITFLLAAIALTAIAVAANAQKLPNVQTANLRAPANIKTDGKLIQWGNKLQAYNHSTSIFYTIANDDDNLYLIIQAKDPVISKKFIAGGIAFTINTAGKKNNHGNIVITYPNLDEQTKSNIAEMLNLKLDTRNPDASVIQPDSVIAAMNTFIQNSSKEIKITGSKTLPDSLISVYNDEGIKTVARFDNKKVIVCALAVPLKYLGLTINSTDKFNYQIMLNSIISQQNITYFKPGAQVVSVSSVPMSMAGKSEADNDTLNYTTDFWGVYTLTR